MPIVEGLFLLGICICSGMYGTYLLFSYMEIRKMAKMTKDFLEAQEASRTKQDGAVGE
jgi:CHASE3 domain sensor protein